VDDHHIIRTSLHALLEKYEGIKVVAEVPNGLEVLRLFENGIEADIILSDVMMPEMDGLSLITALKENHNHTKVVLLSV